MLFLGITSWKGVSCFNGGEVVFQMGGVGVSFLSGDDIGFGVGGRGGVQNYRKMREGRCPPCPPAHHAKP